MTTAETVRTPLTLLVAFPRLPMQGAPQEALRCGPAPPDSAALGGTASRSLAAWGQLYTDRGDQVCLSCCFCVHVQGRPSPIFDGCLSVFYPFLDIVR